MARRLGRFRPWVLVIGLAGLLVFAPASRALAFNARSADSFVDSIGVNVHLSYNDTPYGEDLGAVEQRLVELGVRHVRDGLQPNRPDQYQALAQLAAVGIRSTLIMGSPALGTESLDNELMPVLEGPLAGDVDAVEGPNEYNASGDPESAEHLRAYQQHLYEVVKGSADPSVATLPVIGPSIIRGQQATLGDVSSYLDFGNIHSYPEGEPPEKLGSFINHAKLNSGEKPIEATETGYTTAINWTPGASGENRPVSEAAMATYVPRLFLEYFRWGIVRTFSYELVDQYPDPALDQRDDDFGLLRNDLSPKPAFTALANEIRILEDPGRPFSPGQLDYVLSDKGTELPAGESPELHKVLLEKRDGTFYLALWRTTSVWNPETKQPIAAPTEPVSLDVPAGIAAAAVYRPNQSAGPVWSANAPAQPLSVEVGPQVTIVAIAPGAEGAEGNEPAASASTATVAPPAPTLLAGAEEPSGRCVVPRLRQRRLPGARRMLRAAGCRLGSVTGSRGPRARVKRQSPAPGTVLPAGARVGVRLGTPGSARPQ